MQSRDAATPALALQQRLLPGELLLLLLQVGLLLPRLRLPAELCIQAAVHHHRAALPQKGSCFFLFREAKPAAQGCQRYRGQESRQHSACREGPRSRWQSFVWSVG